VDHQETTTRLLGRWRDGDEAAAAAIYDRFASRLGRLAARRIGQLLLRRTSPDDILQSTFRTFFRRARAGTIQIDCSGAAWRLLTTITVNKVRKQVERHRAGKRDIAREIHASRCGLDQQFCDEPGPDDAVAVIDEIQWLLGEMAPGDAEIFSRVLAGETTQSIAADLQCSRWTVWRVRERIVRRLERRLAEIEQSKGFPCTGLAGESDGEDGQRSQS
jgi:DNA-directed RNA polymerase specialized sigma24 family protein